MSLDRQRILSELGSVMNQLKSADCGCMGKLFSNQNQGEAMGSSLPTCGGCRRGHGYGFHAACAGEPYSMGHNTNHSMNRPCMGHCNPPKLYADTYSYLNDNLMQPVVKEVYNDIKSINPGNTIMNNPLGNQLGLSQGNPGAMAQGNAGSMGNPMQNSSGLDPGNAAMGQPQPPMNAMGGMGPQIVNMIMGDSGMKPSNIQRLPQGQMESAPQSSPGQTGAMNNMNMSAGANQGQYMTGQPGNMSGFANPPTQFVSKENMYSTGAVQNNVTGNPGTQQMGQLNQGAAYSTTSQMGNMNPGTQQTGSMNQGAAYSGAPQMGNMNNPNVQQMSATNQPQYSQNAQSMMQNMNPGTQRMAASNKPQYGQHSQGMMKFNEMFPGVMQGGDLGFDPMAIAIQMNPANQQKAAMDTMQKLMTGGPASRLIDSAGNAGAMKPVAEATRTAVESVSNPNPSQGQQNVLYNNQVSNQQLNGQQQILAQQNTPQSPAMPQQIIAPGQQVNPNAAGAIPPQQTSAPQQQVYTAVTGQPMMNQQQLLNQQEGYQQPHDPNQQYQQQNQLYADPSTGVTFVPAQGGSQEPTQAQATQPSMREPIFPADTSRNRPYTYPKSHQKYYDYNTLGQPVEMLPAKMFHPPEPSLPQTLSPQAPTTKPRNDYLRYSNVKSTVSKTSLAGNKPEGRTPSRSQLQHIYNQYKGSQSFTQQSVRPPVQGATFSEGKINIPPSNANPPQQVPVERVGGDTVANNQVANNRIPNKVEQVMGQIGDVPVAYNKPQGDGAPLKPPGSPIGTRQAKCRNGLQDVVYTSYPSSAAWSFHGTNTYRPVSVGYRFRNIK